MQIEYFDSSHQQKPIFSCITDIGRISDGRGTIGIADLMPGRIGGGMVEATVSFYKAALDVQLPLFGPIFSKSGIVFHNLNDFGS